MVSRAVVTTLSGMGAFVSAGFLPNAQARAVAKLAGLGVGAVGAAMLFDEIRRAGGIGGLADGFLRDIGDTETRAVSETPDATLVDPAVPSFGPERFVIPFVGSFRPKPFPDEIARNTLRNSYPLRVILRNFSQSAVRSSFIIDTEEDAVISQDSVQLVHAPVTLGPGDELEVSFDMPLSPGSRIFRVLPFVTAKLTWPADVPFKPRGQDVVSFRVV